MTYLDKILLSHREQAKTDSRKLDHLLEKVGSVDPARGFAAALGQASQKDASLAVISEIKKASPSKGLFERSGQIETVENWAQCYADGGATCLSVLTDSDFFQGSVDDLQTARRAVSLPVLRKDFTVSVNDVVDARLMEADAVLLIVAALDQSQLRDFYDLAKEIDLDVLVETHDEAEVERALAVGATMIGVNQRDLETFEVDTQRALRVGRTIPDDVLRVAESGIEGPAAASELKKGGYDAVLVGESLVTSGDPAKSVNELRSV